MIGAKQDMGGDRGGAPETFSEQKEENSHQKEGESTGLILLVKSDRDGVEVKRNRKGKPLLMAEEIGAKKDLPFRTKKKGKKPRGA